LELKEKVLKLITMIRYIRLERTLSCGPTSADLVFKIAVGNNPFDCPVEILESSIIIISVVLERNMVRLTNFANTIV
jgi:hypothetical protein